jgi:hypothetical protein
MPVLGYIEWRSFQAAIERAPRWRFDAAGETSTQHFVEKPLE